MARKASLSGFPEYLPAERLVENHVLDTLRETLSCTVSPRLRLVR